MFLKMDTFEMDIVKISVVFATKSKNKDAQDLVVKSTCPLFSFSNSGKRCKFGIYGSQNFSQIIA